MAQTFAFRERRDALAAWLRDRFGPPDQPDAPDAMFWRDAADLIKFLTANGFTITRTEEDQVGAHPEYLRGMRSAVNIVGQFIEQKRYGNPASIPDLETIRDGLSMGVSMAELDADEEGTQ